MTRIIIAALLIPLMFACSQEEVADKAGGLKDMAGSAKEMMAKYKDMGADKMGEMLKGVNLDAIKEKGMALTGDAKTGFMDKFKKISDMKTDLMGKFNSGELKGDMLAKGREMMAKIMSGVAELKKMVGM